MDIKSRTEIVRKRALELGFDACGFSRAQQLDQEARRLEEWLLEGSHGEMGWMERNFDKRTDPRKLVPGTTSVISVIGSYHYEKNLEYDRSPNVPKIAKYARGRDYHKVFKQRLFKLFDDIKSTFGQVEGRVFVDSAPVMDKVWAEKAGLGWIGKNSNLLNRTHGSWFLIGEILLDLEFSYNSPVTDHCGSCTKCIDACPTNAIHEPYKVDSNRCISYVTIELKESVPEELKSELGPWMFGCDICQDVCPWNRKAQTSRIEDFRPREKMLVEDPGFWRDIGLEEYQNLFNGTPVRRATYSKFKENARMVADNLQDR